MIIFGKNPVLEILRINPEKVLELYIGKGVQRKSISEIISLSRSNNISVKHLDNSEINQLCSTSKHQGIAAKAKEYRYRSLMEILDSLKGKSGNKLLVLLDHIEDPHNLGAIIRTVDVLGGDAVVIPKDRSASVNSTVVNTSAGAVNYVPVAMEVNLTAVITTLKKKGFWIVGADQDSEKVIEEIDTGGLDLALVVGSEGKGLSEGLKKKCDFVVKIPNTGKINSLNASVAAGILIYHLKCH